MPPVASVAIPFALFDHNWIDNNDISNSWETDAQSGISADEQRRGILDKPYRLVKSSGLTIAVGQVGECLQMARKATGGRFYNPLTADQSYTTQDDAAGLVVHCDTTYRRFFVGFKAMVVLWNREKKATNIHVGTIASIAADSITFSSGQGPAFAVPKGSSVFPAIECEPDINTPIKVVTDRYVMFDIEARERVGATALPALQAGDTIPAGESSYQGIPILTIPHTWLNTEGGERRKNIQTQVGLDTIPQLYGPTSLMQGALTFQGLVRSEAWRTLKFFDSRCGSLFNFWYPNSTEDLPLVSFAGTSVVVKTSISPADLLERKFIGIWVDGVIQVKRITVATDSGGGNVGLTVDTPVLVPSQYTLVKVSFVSLAKFDTDSLQEEWQTDGTMRCTLKVVGVNVNSCNNGEVGDNGCDVPPDIVDPNTNEGPEEPWEPHECGSPPVAIPMFEDATQALNSWREAVRAADLNMPSQIFLELRDGFVQDFTHSPTTISTELMELLVSEHKLEYAGILTGNSANTSRNPYHLRLLGSNPSDPNTWGFGMAALPGATVTRRIWRKIKTYKVDEGTPSEVEHTLELRFIAEWSTDADSGMKGALTYVVGFSTEINPGYVEGTAYAPHNNATYFRNDPFVWGAFYYPGIPEKKLCHPHALFFAMGTTSWHAPAGYTPVLPDQERFRSCHKIPNGAPWSANDPEFSYANTHFGTTVGTINMAAISLGGAFPTSEYFEWMCIENSDSDGLTALSPSRPGWNEDEGDLTPDEGNDIGIRVCNPGQALQALNACRGHPDEPFGGVGGSHTCWRSSLDPDYMCISTQAMPVAVVLEKCRTNYIDYGPFNPGLGQCDPITARCAITASIENKLPTQLYDYYLAAPPAVPNVRTIMFKGFYDDPDYARRSWEFVDLDSYDDWDQQIGFWSETSFPPAWDQFTCTAVSGSSILRAYHRYRPFTDPTWKFEDGIVEFVSKNTTAIVAFVLRWRAHPISGEPEGYLCVLDRSVNTLKIFVCVNGVATQIGATIITGEPSNINRVLTVGMEGSKIWINTPKGAVPGGEDKWVCEAEDCTFQDGGDCGLAILNNVAGSVFEHVKIYDLNWRKVTVEISADGFNQLHCVVAQQACKLWGSCNNTFDCEGACNCTEYSELKIGIYAASSVSISNVVPKGDPNPYFAEGGACTGPGCPPFPPCGSCPSPFKALSVELSTTCFDPLDPPQGGFWQGLDAYYAEVIVCP